MTSLTGSPMTHEPHGGTGPDFPSAGASPHPLSPRPDATAADIPCADSPGTPRKPAPAAPAVSPWAGPGETSGPDVGRGAFAPVAPVTPPPALPAHSYTAFGSVESPTPRASGSSVA